ncbi:MAG: hypothetical protein IT305_00545 [Chloroflexi bacterium]|nr:hypothetical protein [Chloroflexota bacterium]
MSDTSLPHRIRVGRITYALDREAVIPPNPTRIGTDAEGRAIYGDPRYAASRKRVFLASAQGPLTGYVRDDPPAGLSLTDVLHAAFHEPLPRPAALGVLALLVARHVVLADGTRLGGSRDEITQAVASVALEPEGLVAQARRVPDWALAEALRPRADELSARIVTTTWVRELADPEFGFVRAVTPAEVTVARGAGAEVDVGSLLEIRAQDGGRPAVTVRVCEVEPRDVRVVQVSKAHAEGVGHGDPAFFVPVLRRPADPA